MDALTKKERFTRPPKELIERLRADIDDYEKGID